MDTIGSYDTGGHSWHSCAMFCHKKFCTCCQLRQVVLSLLMVPLRDLQCAQISAGNRVNDRVCRVWRPTRHITDHFGDESLQAINCTGTDDENNETKSEASWYSTRWYGWHRRQSAALRTWTWWRRWLMSPATCSHRTSQETDMDR